MHDSSLPCVIILILFIDANVTAVEVRPHVAPQDSNPSALRSGAGGSGSSGPKSEISAVEYTTSDGRTERLDTDALALALGPWTRSIIP